MSKWSSVAKCVLSCLAVALVILFATSNRAAAQVQQTATIVGTATDPSGAAIVGAKITATNEATGLSRSTQSDQAGRFTIPELPVGTYTVEASQSGFQTVDHKGVTLSVGSTVAVDMQLPVGQVSQTVSVESQVSRVETTTSEVSTLVSPTQMRELPLNGRNFEQLLALAPGVSTIAPAFNAVTGRLYGMMNNYSIAGSRPTGQMFLLDGTDIRDFWEHATGSGYAGTSLGVEAIGEFQVLTSSYSAQYGGNGAVMNAVSRSGTNDLHGGLYEFLRNSRLDALDSPDKVAKLTSPPPFKRNQFGVALGGPIKKNKVFFFGNYEGLREGLEQTTPFNVPEPYVAQGMLPCYNPITGAPINTSSSSCPSPGGGAVDSPGNPVEPISNPSQTVENIAALYALCKGCTPVSSTQFGVPVAAGVDVGGYFAVASKPNLITNEDYTLGRVDFNISSTDTLFTRYVLDDARVQDNPRDPTGIFPELDFTRNQFLTIGENHIFSPNLVNSLHFGYVRNNENSRVQQALTAAQLSKAGLTADPLTFVTGSDPLPRQDGQFSALPGVNVIGPDQNRPDTLIQSKFSGGEDLVWNHGGHGVKLGVVITRIQTNNVQTAYANGTLYFPNGSEQANLQGFDSFAFAVPPGQNNSTRYFREINIAPYIQDDWKLSSRLTLNLGFRIDYDTNPVGWSYGGGPLTTIVGSFLPPIGPIAGTGPFAPFTAVHHVLASNPNSENFEPRFGFAYSPFKDNKTAFRGGIGVFYDPTAPRLWESGFIATPPAGFAFIFGAPVPNPFANGVPPGTASEFAGVSYQLSGHSAITSGSPYQLQYNFDIQRQITPATMLTVGYVGSVSRHLWTQGDINPPKCSTYPNCAALPQIPQSYPTTSNGTFTVNTQNGNTGDPNSCVIATQTTCYGSGARFPYFVIPGINVEVALNRINAASFGSLIQAYNTGASSYNSLQVSLNHQFASNFTGQFNYTYSHCIDDGSFASSLEEWAQLVTDRYNQSYDYENCNFDVRHNVSANALYTLPFKGNRLVEGWRFSTVLGIHSGLPLNVYNGSVLDPADLGSEWGSRANYSFAAGCHPNHVVDRTLSPGIIQWFDTSCYEAQAPGFLGNIRRNSLPGPGTISADFSITKETKITEKLNMEFRAEAFNFINHLNPGANSPVSGTVLGAINSPGGASGTTEFSQNPSVTPRQIQFALKFDF